MLKKLSSDSIQFVPLDTLYAAHVLPGKAYSVLFVGLLCLHRFDRRVIKDEGSRSPVPIPPCRLRILSTPRMHLLIRPPQPNRPAIRARRKHAVRPIDRANLARLPSEPHGRPRHTARARAELRAPVRAGRADVPQERRAVRRAPAREPAAARRDGQLDVEGRRRAAGSALVAPDVGLALARRAVAGERLECGQCVCVDAGVCAVCVEEPCGRPGALHETGDAPRALCVVERGGVDGRRPDGHFGHAAHALPSGGPVDWETEVPHTKNPEKRRMSTQRICHRELH